MIAFRLWRRNALTNAFIIVQLTVVLVVTVLSISSIYERFAQYLPLRKLLNQKGAIVLSLKGYQEPLKSTPYRLDYRNTKPLSDDFSSLQECWYTQYSVYLHSEQFHNMDVIGYDKNVINLYEPELQQGNWRRIMNMTQTSNGNLPAIICQKGYDYKVGDIFEMESITYENANISVSIEVMGMLEAKTQIFGGNTSGSGITYESFFSTPAEIMPNDESFIMMILPMAAVDAANIIAFYHDGYSLMLYPSDLSDKEYAERTSLLQTKYDSFAEPLSSVQVKSKQILHSQILTVVPILICLICMAFMSAVCVNAVIAYRSMRENGVFEICGASKKRCILIHFMQMCLSIGISILLSYMILFIGAKIFLIHYTFNLMSALLCSLICFLVIAFSVFLPAKLIVQTHPQDLLKAE